MPESHDALITSAVAIAVPFSGSGNRVAGSIAICGRRGVEGLGAARRVLRATTNASEQLSTLLGCERQQQLVSLPLSGHPRTTARLDNVVNPVTQLLRGADPDVDTSANHWVVPPWQSRADVAFVTNDECTASLAIAEFYADALIQGAPVKHRDDNVRRVERTGVKSEDLLTDAGVVTATV